MSAEDRLLTGAEIDAFELSGAPQSVTTDVRARAMRAPRVTSEADAILARHLARMEDEA